MGRKLKTYTISIDEHHERKVRAFKAKEAKRIIWNDIKHDSNVSWEDFEQSAKVIQCREC